MNDRSFGPDDPRIVTLVATIGDTRDARNAAVRQERTVEDDHDFREIRSLMRSTHGVCG